MATQTSHPAAAPRQVYRPSHRGTPASTVPHSAVSPPSKRELASWWKKFRKTTEKEEEEKARIAPGIFGVPLADSIRYANVAISLTNEHGDSFIYGYVPIVVAKCGVFLKEKATEIEGIFRMSGSAKRIKDLQTIFDSPERYGKGLDWTGYTVHDASNIFRRYLNQLPEPIVPLEFYDRFRAPLRSHEAQAVGDMEAKGQDGGDFDYDGAVATYQKLITELPPLNRQLLLYVLDLLAVFASKSDHNRMNAGNLAAIFQPGIISHPIHDMEPDEYRLSQNVLVFLIENQDNFLFGMDGTAIDEKTVKDMESRPPPTSPPKVTMGRSASNASGGAESVRKLGRRNSVSSRHSKGSTGAPSPGTPGTPLANATSSAGVHRSNTVPTKKSPALVPTRFQRPGEAGTPTTASANSPPYATDTFDGRLAVPAGSPPIAQLYERPTREEEEEERREEEEEEVGTPKAADGDRPAEAIATPEKKPIQQNLPANLVAPPSNVKNPSGERKASGLFARSPILGPKGRDGEQRDGRQPRKLQKKQRIPGSANESAQSSQTSLPGDAAGQSFHTPLASPELVNHNRPDPMAAFRPLISNTGATPIAEVPPGTQHPIPASSQPTSSPEQASNALRPVRSPQPSVRSRSSYSDFEGGDEQPSKPAGHRRRWPFSSSGKNNSESPLAPPPPIGQHHQGARGSSSSVGSSQRPRKSFTNDSQQTQQTGTGTDTSSVRPNQPSRLSEESSELLKEKDSGSKDSGSKDSGSEREKKGLFGKWKAKLVHSKDERREREAEKERARSPQKNESQHGGAGQRQGHGHPHGMSAFTHEHLPGGHRGRSIEQQRENVLPSVSEVSPGLGVEGTNNMVPPTPVTAIRTEGPGIDANVPPSTPSATEEPRSVEEVSPKSHPQNGQP